MTLTQIVTPFLPLQKCHYLGTERISEKIAYMFKASNLFNLLYKIIVMSNFLFEVLTFGNENLLNLKEY